MDSPSSAVWDAPSGDVGRSSFLAAVEPRLAILLDRGGARSEPSRIPFCDVSEAWDVTWAKLRLRSSSASFRFLSGENPRRWRFGARMDGRLDRSIVPNRDIRLSERKEPLSSEEGKVLACTGDGRGAGAPVEVGRVGLVEMTDRRRAELSVVVDLEASFC